MIQDMLEIKVVVLLFCVNLVLALFILDKMKKKKNKK
jgi:hypothetical protein